MKLARSIQACGKPDQGCVLTIGNFDGVHRGHQGVVHGLVERSRQMGLPAILMTFFPTPQEYFRAEEAAPRLTSLTTRYLYLKDSGIDTLIALPFNKSLARTSAEDFILEYIVKGLGTRFLMAGDDFRFGAQRRGDYAMLKSFGLDHGFELTRCTTVEEAGERISSTRIRQALKDGDLELAERLLGRSYEVIGRVRRGDQRGRTWGFPTLNLPFKHKSPMFGVFAVRVGIDKQVIEGVANLGARPTVDGKKMLLEVHLFNFNQDIYGQRVRVKFIRKIRDEHRFDTFDALKQQISEDCKAARLIHKSG